MLKLYNTNAPLITDTHRSITGCPLILLTTVIPSQVGKENVQTALSLVCYDHELHRAMEWVFGTAFICRDMDSAKRVTFDRNIMKKSVTLDGDVFDPAGTLTGGEWVMLLL